MSNYVVPTILNEKDFAEFMRVTHYAVATSTNRAISQDGSNVYRTSKAAFLAAIATAYPDLPTIDIYNEWVDNGESVAWNAYAVQRRITDETRELAESEINNLESLAYGE